MRIQLKNFLFSLDLNNALPITTLTIENKELFRHVVYSLLNEAETTDCQLLLEDNSKLIPPSKKLSILHDFYTYDINKNHLTNFFKFLKKRILLENHENFLDVKCRLDQLIYQVLEPYDIYVDLNIEWKIEDVLKASGIKLKTNETNLLDHIINIISFICEITGGHYFVLIDFKQNFTCKELLNFYQFISYNHFKVILVETQIFPIIKEYESSILIDQDFCEIY